MFPESARLIYQAVIDGEPRFFDPVRVVRQLEIHTHGALSSLVNDVREGLGVPDGAGGWEVEPAAPESPARVKALVAQGHLAGAAYAAFGMEPLDPYTGAGTTEDAAWAVLLDFLRWRAEKKTPGGTPA